LLATVKTNQLLSVILFFFVLPIFFILMLMLMISFFLFLNNFSSYFPAIINITDPFFTDLLLMLEFIFLLVTFMMVSKTILLAILI